MSEQPMRCRRCGAMLPETAQFCSQCGARHGERAPEMPFMKVLWAVGLAMSSVLLGGLGTCFLGFGFTALAGSQGGAAMGILMLLVGAAAFAGVVKILTPRR